MSDAMTIQRMEQTEEFLELLRTGVGSLTAAVTVGWSPAQLRQFMRDEEFVALATQAQEHLYEDIEHTLFTMARNGNMKAIQMVLYNRRAGQWRDVRHIQVDKRESLDVGIVVSVKQAAIELLQAQGVQALQPGGHLDAIETTATDER